MRLRKEYYEQQYSTWIKKSKKRVQIVIMCEVDILPNGKLALPQDAFSYVDAVIVSLHSSFTQPRKEITDRIVAALTTHPKVRILGHPTARLLSKREGVDAYLPVVFDVCKQHDIALEINAYPDRLDLPDRRPGGPRDAAGFRQGSGRAGQLRCRDAPDRRLRGDA